MSRSRPVLVRGLLAVLLLAVFAAVSGMLAIPRTRALFNEQLAQFLDGIQSLGTWGPTLVGAAFIPVCLFFLPGSPVTLFGGFAFGGTWAGFARTLAAVSLGSTLGASLAFLIARYVARDWIAARIAARPTFQAIDAAIGREGFKFVLLLRLSPVFPFNLLNYGCGVTRVTFRDYVLASWLGMLPGTVLFIYLGSTTRQLADILAGRVERTPTQQAFFILGLLATGLAVVLITRVARCALREAVPDPSSRDSQTPGKEP